MAKKIKKDSSLSKLKVGVSITALVAAVAMFVILLQMEKGILSQYEKGTVYLASEPIPKGQMITEENYMQYFTMGELDKTYIPDCALTEPEQVQGMAAVFDVAPGVLLAEGMFEKLEDIVSGMAEPVIAGFKAEDMYQVAGGILRAGDRIHIYSVKKGETILVWEEVYIQQAFDASGVSIPNTDKSTAAQRLNVYLDKKDIEAFYTELAAGSLRVVKMCE